MVTALFASPTQREVLKHKGHSIESFSYVIVKKGRREEGEGEM